MFKTFFLLEIKSALKRPMIYIFTSLMMLLVFAAVSSDSVVIGGSVGQVFKNAPHVITSYTTIMALFGLLVAAAFYNNAALRDHKNHFSEILFSTPLSKSGYFFGRFCGALILSTIPMLGVFLGILLGTLIAPLAGWSEADRFGSFYLETFVNNYFLFILPNMFFAGTIIFSLATKWKNSVISFVGALVIIMTYIISGTLLSDIDNQTIAALSDTFGIRTYTYYTEYFTTIEKNTLSPGFSGILLWNRLIWISIGCLILMASYFNFSFQQKNKKLKKQKESSLEIGRNFALPILNPVYDRRTDWLQFKSFFYTNFLSIIKSITFKILFLFSAIILISNLVGGYEYFGLKAYPLTYKLIDTINGASSIFVVIILVFFSGELIWRDRESKISEVIDATPHTSFISLVAKALSLVGVTVVLHFFFVLCGISYQLIMGFDRIELGVYLLDFFYSNLIVYAVWSGVMIMIQVLLNNKYIGYFISILVVFAWEIIAMMMDVESNMLMIGGGPSLRYSDMNAFGPGLRGALWFNLYWVLFALICLLIAGALWNRGVVDTLKNRIQNARKEVPKSFRVFMGLVGLIWLLVAGFIFYNTQILNSYKTSKEQEKLVVKYEQLYKKHESAALPKVTDIQYFIDIFPEDRDVFVKAITQLTNETDTPIDSIHFNTNWEWETEFDIPNSTKVWEDKVLGYMIFELNQAMQPNDSFKIEIRTKYLTQGFENERGNTDIVNNGTFLNNFSILPQLGYSARNELSNKNKRKKYDLMPKERMAELESDCSAKCMKNYLTNGTCDFIDIESVISTSGDQIAVAPGTLVKQWTENGRNYYHYKVDHPSQNFYSFISARYEVAKRKWNDVDIEVYYDEKHSTNVEMMMDAVERSLDYYTSNFGPYMHQQCRIVEFPRYRTFAQAFPGTMPYSEAIGFVINLEDSEKNNIVDAVIAHEMAHQWWAHQVIGASMQGATMFSESFAEYSSLMTMKHLTKDPMKMRQFLKYDHHRYLRGRSTEEVKELPLYKVENQMHIHYGKGSVILYALQDYIGEDKVNNAMRNFLNEFKYQKPPYPTSLDFIKHLEPEVPDSLKYLIDDWFKEITLYDNRMKEASYKALDNGKYVVNMKIESDKIRADSIGNEQKVAINDWIDLGVFSDHDEKNLLFEKRVKIDRHEMEFSFEVDSQPVKAAIDPRRLLIDRVYKDNVKTLTIQE